MMPILRRSDNHGRRFSSRRTLEVHDASGTVLRSITDPELRQLMDKRAQEVR
jgi:uncharacterized protein YxjI